jgi:nitrite reductase (NADH) large subunit
MPTLMERQLDPAAGYLLGESMKARGIKVMTSANTRQILGDKRVTGVEFADGSTIPADLVVMAVGIRPNVALAKSAELAVNRGIVVDAQMRTSDLRSMRWGNASSERGDFRPRRAALRHGQCAAAQLCGDDKATFTPVATATRLKVTGVNLYSAGDFAEGTTARRSCCATPRPASTSG